jgi:signal transduction histidine kinase
MFAWSVNDLYLACSAVLFLLSWLLLASRRNYLVWQFVMATIALSAWNLCIYILGETLLPSQVSLVSRVQLVAVLLFCTGLLNFCWSFPASRPYRLQLLTASVSAAFSAALLFTRDISDAVLENGSIRYLDGRGFTIYTGYICLLVLMILAFLARAWRRFPEQRNKIRFFFAGTSTFVISASVFNLVFPIFGNYDYLLVGRLSCTVAALLFFYAIAKHEFLDVTVIINKQVAWGCTLLLMGAMALLAYQLAANNQLLETVAIVGVVWISALIAGPLQKFLLTSAKRKFIKGWYEADEVFRRLGNSVTQESSREAIFRLTLDTLDEVFELEDALLIVALREQLKLSGYRVQKTLKKLAASEPLLAACKDKHSAILLEALDHGSRQQLKDLLPLLRDKAVIIPFHSPEYLEGVLVLGPKSSGAGFTDADMLFFNNLINYLSPVLYRLTPIETLERLYNENQKKLHDAEIQLLRAQKIESIVHATRQCHHEIRTPLNIIKLGIGRIKTMQDLENYKLIAMEEIDHAIEIVEETLAISDVSKPVSRAFANINVNEVIYRCLRLVDRSRYQVSLDLAKDLPAIKGFFSDLQVVITNLIHNALEAMPEGGTLSFSTKVADNNIQIRVEDTGAGIAPELRSRVWEPYFSGKGGSVGNTTGGRGWGLTIVNRIINEHSGSIHMSSEVGVGTCFVITLPSANVLSTASDVAPAAIRA